LVIEKDKLGGCCANKGCIPTKALLKSAKLYHDIKNAARFGIKVETVKPDFGSIFKRVDRVVSSTRKGIELLLKSYNIEVVCGEAMLMAGKRVDVDGRIFEAKNIVISTGSIPIGIPGVNFNDFVLNSDSVFDLVKFPESMVIVGGGAIGVEFANVFSFFGTKVTIVEMADNIVPTEDIEVSVELEKIFKRYGIDIYTKSTANIKGGSVEIVTGENKVTLKSEKALIAIGRRPLIKEDDMKANGIEFNSSGIKTDDRMRTNVDNIYAIGDVTGKHQLAHVAIKQGVVAAHNIMGNDSTIDYSVVPSCIYTKPEIGSVGLRSQDDESLQTGKFPFISSGKARADEMKDGFVKVLSKDGKIVGVHIIGGCATELISEGGMLINEELDIKKIVKNIHPHPTFSESIVQAIDDINNSAVDLPKMNN
ncbi:MAG: dihydrolipoyl dehydrogenase, partial [Candidatus Anammoxibacter sp.]